MPATRSKRLTRETKARLRDVLEANGLGPCSHPDCNPHEPSCASNAVYIRALEAVTQAFKIGRGEVVASDEP